MDTCFYIFPAEFGSGWLHLAPHLVRRQSRLLYTPISNEMPITYLTNSLRLPLSGSCDFNGSDERPKHASRLCAVTQIVSRRFG